MLHSKQITKVLSQGLTETPLPTEAETRVLVAPILISLLSNKGIPLSTVYSSLDSLTVDNIKIYLLLIFNYYQSLRPADHWAVMELDKSLSIMIKQICGDSGSEDVDVNGNQLEVAEEPREDMYVVIIYDKRLPNSVAKLKVDNLAEGLRGGFA